MKLAIIITNHFQSNKLAENARTICAEIDEIPPESLVVCVVDDSESREEKQAVMRAMEKLGKKNHFAFIHFVNCLGVGYSRNKGLERVDADWIWFVDGDDDILPGSIGRIFDACLNAKEGVDAIALPFFKVSPDGMTSQSVYRKGFTCRAIDLPVMPWSKVVRKDSLCCGFRVYRGLEDNDWWFRTCENIRSVETLLGEPVYRYYHAQPGSQTEIVHRLFKNADSELPRDICAVIQDGDRRVNKFIADELRVIAEAIDIRDETEDDGIRSVVDWWIRRNLRIFRK